MADDSKSPIQKPDGKAPATEGKAEDITDEMPVTLGVMEQYIGGIMKDWNESQKKQFDSFMAGMSQQLDPIVKRVNELTQIINDATKRQPEPEHKEQVKKSFAEIAQEIAPLIQLAREQGLISTPASSELDAPTLLVKKAIDRESRLILMKMIRGSLKKGTLFPEEIEEVLGSKIDDHAAPV